MAETSWTVSEISLNRDKLSGYLSQIHPNGLRMDSKSVRRVIILYNFYQSTIIHNYPCSLLHYPAPQMVSLGIYILFCTFLSHSMDFWFWRLSNSNIHSTVHSKSAIAANGTYSYETAENCEYSMQFTNKRNK